MRSVVLVKIVVTLLVATVLGLVPTSAAVAVQPIDPAVIGDSPDNAAGSCWEIKLIRPTASDGTYWLLTPEMSEPRQVYCDQTTNGGGWVLVGKGRDGWTSYYEGKGQAAQLLSPDLNPMGSTAHQMHSRDVDALMNGGRVADLQDGIRIRRATNTAGTGWQEVRARFTKMNGWTWALGTEHPLSTWSFDGTNGSGGQWQNFGSGQQLTRMVTTTNSAKNWKYGFGYGTGVTGQNNSTSYLWAATDGGGSALPYAQVYIRPRVLSTDSGFDAIADSGTEAIARKLVTRSTAMVTPWGVTGIAGSVPREGSVEVQAFTQSGNRMYVGGNFRYVQQDAGGAGRVEQPFLAAFNVDTGEWISSFRPTFNEQVRALTTLPDGTVIAGGDFSQANGQPATAVVALDPGTGATRANWNVTLENRVTGGVLGVRALAVSGNFVYIGGAVTHFSGGSAPNTTRYMRGLGRVSVANGTPSADWNPEFNGSVAALDGSDDESRMYAAGFFSASKAVTARGAAAVLTAPNAELATPLWEPVWSATKFYQQGIQEVGDRVWVGGSEHNMFSFDRGTFERLSGEITKNTGGDVQAIAADQGVVYSGSHASDMSYANAFTWPSVGTGWTDVHTVKWVAAFDEATGKRIPDFVPTMSLRLGSGVWAIQPDSNGNVWMGGDLEQVQTNQGARFSGGFARYPMVDATPPGVPGNFRTTSQTATQVSLAWNTVSDASGGVRYQVLLDDRPIAVTSGNQGSITVPKGGAGRYFVRAVDGAGNVGASTAVLKVGSGVMPPSASFAAEMKRATVSVDAGDSSASSGSIESFVWDFGDGTTGEGETATHSYEAAGDYIVRLTVTDSSGGAGTTSQLVTAGNPPRPRPSDVYGGEVYDGEPWAYYRLNEPSGAIARDFGPDGRDGTYSGTVTRGVVGALVNTDDRAISTGGSSGFIVSPRASAAPTEFTIGAWFRTTSTSGGRLIGYGNSSTGLSSSYDRHIYIQNNGQLVFGVYNGAENRVTSPGTYRDGNWHYAVATLSPSAGMKLYVDGQMVGSNPNTTAENFLGYWRVGGDRVWSGASSSYLNGSLDEGVVYLEALSAEQIAQQWTLGSTVVTPPDNTPPTASFTADVEDLEVAFDASDSSDVEGPIQSYTWNFGDGNTGTGRTPTHTYEAGGTYTVELVVTDSEGATDSATEEIEVTAPPVVETVVARSASWRWQYATQAPPAEWKDVDFDASGWGDGNAVLGFGSSTVATNIDSFATPQDRARAAYFRRTFQVSDTSRAVKLKLTSVADDGAVYYVNGTEVGRDNMPTGSVTHQTYASSSRRENVANASPVVIDVPLNLLRNGTNVVAAQTHVAYRATPDLTFHLEAELTSNAATGGPADPVADFSASAQGMQVSVDAGASHDPDGTIVSYAWEFGDGAVGTGRQTTHTYTQPGDRTITLQVTDNSGRSATTTRPVSIESTPTETEVVAAGSSWRWRYLTEAPPAGWNSRTFDSTSWNSGPAPFGWGAPIVATNIDTFANPQDRPRAAYFTKSFDIANIGSVEKLVIESAGDDGAVIYVNGTEVARANMPAGAISHTTYASSARRYNVANASPIVVEVPVALLVEGTNVVSAQSHVNFRATADLTFDLKAVVTTQ